DQVAAGAAHGLNPLVANYGPALLDRAVLDALCRVRGISVFNAMASNLAGITNCSLVPDLDGFDMDAFVRSLRPARAIAARHTVGLVDAIGDPSGGPDDGLPRTLREAIAAYGHRWFKLKVAGDLDADLARLAEIAAELDRIDGAYHVTLDGNEQYRDADGVALLLERIAATPALGRLAGAIAFIEQPIARGAALDTDVTAIAGRWPLLIDESDATLAAFTRARALGYAGVSSKSCKGLYKSILNVARCRMWNEHAGAPRAFMSAEDLSTQAGLAVQQDLALATLIGCRHVERNGHHYVNGMAGVPETEQAAFLAAHADLYHRAHGVVRLTITGGDIALGSLACPGFAAGAEPDWDALRPMPRAA
ncbi:MAG TPA: enolase C-terminal domain-like protein, partial [Alphaproteobacteria bacterium]